jgi:hypothetical protein
MPPANKSIGPVGDGYLAVNPEAFPADFAAGVPKSVADFMAISQVPIFNEALKAKVTVAAWKDKPSYVVVATQDRMINPDLERFMAKRAQSKALCTRARSRSSSKRRLWQPSRPSLQRS